MKKILLILFTIALAYITAYYTSGETKKQKQGDLFYKIKCFVTGEADTTNAKDMLKEAELLYDYKEYEEAIKYYQKAIELDSKYIYLNNSVAQCYLSMKDTSKAIELLLESRYSDKNNNEALILLGNIYLQKKDSAKAEKYLIEANNIYETADVYQSLANIYLNRKDYHNAKIYIDKALNIFPRNVSLLETKRILFLSMNKPDSAQFYRDKIVAISPYFYPDYKQKAEEAKNDGKTRKAINYYALALEENPSNADYYYERAWLYNELEMYDSAYYDFNQAVQLKSDNYIYYFSRAYILDYLDSIHEAIRDYKISLKYKNDYNYTYNNLGYEYYRLKDFENAEKYYSKCIELTPDYYLAIYNRGILYYDNKMYHKAIKDFKNALANSPENTGIIYYLALTYDELNENIKALDYYNEYIRLSDDDIDSSDYNFAVKRIAELSSE